MRKYICVMVAISGFAAGAFAQAPKYKYEFTKFVDSYPNATGKASVRGDDTSKTSFNRASDVYVAANGGAEGGMIWKVVITK
jgi:hypothetical protein